MADVTRRLTVTLSQERLEKFKTVLEEKMPGFTPEDYIKFSILVTDDEFTDWLDGDDDGPDLDLTDEEETEQLRQKIREWE